MGVKLTSLEASRVFQRVGWDRVLDKQESSYQYAAQGRAACGLMTPCRGRGAGWPWQAVGPQLRPRWAPMGT